MRVIRVFLLFLLFAALSNQSTSGAQRPNVIIIMTDDQGYGDFGVTGNEAIETPHMDSLAAAGAWMTNFYVSPVCSPTRACLMTGRYNYRTRVIDTYVGRSMMDPAEVTIAELLRPAGYATGIFGKWHLGDCYPMRPIDQGFQEALVLRGGGLAQPSEPRENHGRYTDPILFHNGKQVQCRGYCTDVYFEAALRFIRKAVNAGRPFFCYIPTNAPHGPFHDVPPAWYHHYLAKAQHLKKLIIGQPTAKEVDKLARIAAMITNIDDNIGRLLRYLNAWGIERNTVIFFLVDNGPNTRRYVGPFRGKKADVYEGGIRSPLWIRWPGKIKPGAAYHEPVAHIDIVPTILDITGVPKPEGLRLDGRSFWGLLTGAEQSLPERSIVIQSHRGDVPVRYHNFMIRRGRWKLLHASGFGRERFTGKPNFELYDVVSDPGERHNLASQKPDLVKQLKAAYDAWFDDVSSTRPDNYAPPRIHIGSPAENPTVLTRQDWRGGTWARNSIGWWVVKIERSGLYDFEVLIYPGKEQETLTLQVAGVRRRTAVLPGADSVKVEGVKLRAGNTEVHATLTGSKGARGVYQVIVTFRGTSP